MPEVPKHSPTQQRILESPKRQRLIRDIANGTRRLSDMDELERRLVSDVMVDVAQWLLFGRLRPRTERLLYEFSIAYTEQLTQEFETIDGCQLDFSEHSAGDEYRHLPNPSSGICWRDVWSDDLGDYETCGAPSASEIGLCAGHRGDLTL